MHFRIWLIMMTGLLVCSCKTDFTTDLDSDSLSAEDSLWLNDANADGEPDSLTKYHSDCSKPPKQCVQEAIEKKQSAQIPDPRMDKEGGIYNDTLSVRLSADKECLIRYSTDGLAPTIYSQGYTKPIPITRTLVLKARAFSKDNDQSSEVVFARYTLKAAAPVSNFESGKYSKYLEVALQSPSTDVVIHYTMDGSVPTTARANKYSQALKISSSVTVKAIAFREGWARSDLMTATYTLSVPGITSAPQFSPPGDVYNEKKEITLTSETPEAKIYYTVDGTSPDSNSHRFSKPVPISESTVIKAIAYHGDLAVSEPTTAIYTLKPKAPKFEPPGEIYSSKQSVRLSSDGPAQSVIRYTTDGTPPNDSSRIYEDPIDVDRFMTISAAAFYPNWDPSFVIKETYYINLEGVAATPIIEHFSEGQTGSILVSISSSDSGAKIYYELGPETPTSSSKPYSAPFVIKQNTTVQAISIKSGLRNSDVARETFNIKAAPPAFHPENTTFNDSMAVTLSTRTEEANIYYTLDDSDPNSNSKHYHAPIILYETTTLKAVTIKPRMEKSDIKTATYTLNTGIQIAPPIFSPDTGTYSEPQTVSLTHSMKDATLLYTTTGVTPLPNSALRYTDPITIEKDTYILARAFKDGFIPSETSAASYIISPKKLIVLQPDSSSKLTTNAAYFITWRWEGNIENVAIEYSTQSQKNAIAASVANTGRYQWTVPEITASDARIHITEVGGTVHDSSAVFSIEPPPKDMATLSALALSGIRFSPDFKSDHFSYEATVPFDVKSTQVTPTTSSSKSTITINGDSASSGEMSPSLPLNEGLNTIEIKVTAEDGMTTETYVINVMQEKPGYPDIIRLPVKLYDHYTPGNREAKEGYWEFNPPARKWGVIKGMVQHHLNPVGVPSRGETDYFNKEIHRWFVKSLDDDPKKWVLAFDDSIAFHHQGDGTYRYSNKRFFPLDGIKGTLVDRKIESTYKGLDKKQHNFGFTMHISKTFVYRKSGVQTTHFEVIGDDDVWVFLNNRLVLDLGGMHQAAKGRFNLVEIADTLGLVEGKSYSFDFFIAERNPVESTCQITADFLILKPNPDLTVDRDGSATSNQ